jgi:hypothetical protein
MMRPLRRGIMLARATAWLRMKMLRALRLMTLSQASNVWSSAGAPQVAPALFTTISMTPNRAVAVSTIFRDCSTSLASATTDSTAMSFACSAAAAASKSAVLREVMSNRA